MHDLVRNSWTIAKREFIAYFSTPLATVFLIIFVALTGAFAFYVGGFFERGQADLAPFFQYHPWLYLLLVPAVAMRLWAEERKSGTIELLMTLPMWITVNVLGSPDNGVIFAGYVGSFLMAGAFLAIGSCISALTKNQVIAFIVSASICFLLVMSGLELVLNVLRAWTPGFVVTAVSSMSFLSHFDRISKGVLDLSAVAFYVSLIAFALFANRIFVELKKAD